jgi:transcriptional regulator with XRE-family HTH domain
MVLLRHLLGDALRRLRLRQGRTLREVSAAARVSLGYLSEVERGQKEASSELLAAICGALETPLSQVFREVSDNFALAELQSEPVLSGTREPSLRRSENSALAQQAVHALRGAVRGAVPASLHLAGARELGDGAKHGDGAKLGEGAEPVIGTIKLPAGHQAGFDDVARRIRDITDMVPV